MSQERELDGELYWSDSSSDCSGIDLEDPNNIYWSDDDDDMMMRWMMMEVGKIFRRRTEPASSATLNLPSTRFHHTTMVTMIQMVTMMKVGGTLKRGRAGSSGNTNTAPLTFTLHI